MWVLICLYRLCQLGTLLTSMGLIYKCFRRWSIFNLFSYCKTLTTCSYDTASLGILLVFLPDNSVSQRHHSRPSPSLHGLFFPAAPPLLINPPRTPSFPLSSIRTS
ncbi:hypothetical protein EDB89DRAFT_1950020 [Lactarius sanguifluus]|nr:hypothetical protein EDB89DRAFT_1950020 [Lactarius sanguifluus]